ncbi:dihydrofolate reductase family protein [Guptibacillus hwajinpoensis]|uniref:dihydrofolate reductase family protein n=1 Tax=Guptibacillus hwajinpoensis TaxID=208199 RepID=UPI001CFE0234|nr:dihydrofolate reductase family protein [Pseudalkalibacillus hwajinpoensis]WLR59817.1 dihydrofolate reductase family protein [Pseudalkalibacillus hwajinpoensis]
MPKRKVSVYIATSVDGYVATEDDSLDWLFKVDPEGDAGYEEFMKDVDTLIMGRRTYDWVMEQEKGVNPYKGKASYVYTTQSRENTDDVTFTSEDPSSLMSRLNEQGGGTVWLIGGSVLVHEFLEKNLIDEFIISLAPALIGKGIPLFQHSEIKHDLELTDVRQYGQFAQLHYLVKKG